MQDALSRIGGVEFPDLQITGSRSVYGYRNKVQFPVQAQNGKPVAGFIGQAAMRSLPSQTAKFSRKAPIGRAKRCFAGWKKEKIAAYDERTHRRGPAYLSARGKQGDPKVLLCLIVNGKTLAKKEALVRTIREQVPEVSGIVINYNTKKSNVILGDRFEALTGDGALEDTLLGLTFRLSPAAFYQVNHDQAERLYETAIEFAGLRGEETALDLYCGSGTITLCLARHVKKVYGVEIVDAAIRDAKENAARNGISNAEFFLRGCGRSCRKICARWHKARRDRHRSAEKGRERGCDCGNGADGAGADCLCFVRPGNAGTRCGKTPGEGVCGKEGTLLRSISQVRACGDGTASRKGLERSGRSMKEDQIPTVGFFGGQTIFAR